MSQTPTEHIPPATPVHSNIFARLYYGELSLPVTFWVFVMLIPLLLGVALLSMAYSPARIEYLLEAFDPTNILITCILLLLCMYAYTFVSLVAGWRAATKYQGRKLWAILVKIWVVFTILYDVWMFPGIFMALTEFSGLIANLPK